MTTTAPPPPSLGRPPCRPGRVVGRSWAVAAAAAVSVVGTVRLAVAAEDAPKAAVIGSCWVGSDAVVRAAAGEAGVQLPPSISLASLEQSFGFLQRGDIRTDAPVGMVFVGGEDVSQQQMAAFVLPLKAGAAPLAAFHNATPTDAADTIAISGFPFRRTDDYLLVGGTVGVTSKVDVAGAAAAMRPTAGGRTPVAMATVDLAAWRAVAPVRFAAAMDSMAQTAPAETDPSRKAGGDWVRQLIRDKLDQCSLAIDRTTDGWTATATVVPFPTPHAPFARPGLPVGCVARADLQLPPAALVGWLKTLFAKQAGGTAPADDLLYIDLLADCFAGDAETVGVGTAGGKPVAYCVTQRTVPDDLAAELDRIKRRGASLGDAGADSQYTTYPAADGQTVYRFASHDSGTLRGYIDVTARGPFRYATFCPTADHAIDDLVAAKPEDGTFDGPGDGWALPGGLVDVVSAFAKAAGGDGGLPDDKRQQLATLFGDGRVSWTAEPHGTGVALAVDVPRPVLKAIRPAVELLTGRALAGPAQP